MTREIVWTAAALAELDEIVAYIRHQDPLTAARVAARIDQRVGSLLANPGSGDQGELQERESLSWRLLSSPMKWRTI